jgi:hypothetical protein
MVHLPARTPAAFFGATLCISAGLAALALWVYTQAETPFDYMVVGTFGATAALTVAFCFLVKRKLL